MILLCVLLFLFAAAHFATWRFTTSLHEQVKLLSEIVRADRSARDLMWASLTGASNSSVSATAKAPGESIRCRLSDVALDAAGASPVWNLILPVGEYHGPTLAPLGGKHSFTGEFFAEMVANWKDNGSPRIPVRWGHEHESNEDPAKQKELDRKAGNITDLRVTAAGLEGLTAWNDAGRKDVQGGEFDGWSAEFRLRHLNRLTGAIGGPLLTGVALTNQPFFSLMPPVAASAVEAPTETTTQEQHMTPEQLKKWALSLGLSADATAEQCISASNARVTDAEAKVAASAKQHVPAEVITAAVKPVQDELAALKVSFAASEAKALELAVDAQVIKAKQGDGKTGRAIPELIVATAKDIAKSKGLPASDAFLAALPLSVPITAVGHDSKEETGTISASDAGKKLLARADELRAKGDTNPMITAMRELPREALIAEGRPTPTA